MLESHTAGLVSDVEARPEVLEGVVKNRGSTCSASAVVFWSRLFCFVILVLS